MFTFSNKTYDTLKKFVQIRIPAVASLYFGLASIWGLPNPEKVVGTLALITTFLGIMLGVSAKSYNAGDAAYDGNLLISEKDDGNLLYMLDLSESPAGIAEKDSFTLRVKKDV